jgi:transposase-like protein
MYWNITMKLCPICGSASIIISNAGPCWVMYCNSCGRNDAEVQGKTKADVVQKWDRLKRI